MYRRWFPPVTIHHLPLDATRPSFYSLPIFDLLAPPANPVASVKRTICAATYSLYPLIQYLLYLLVGPEVNQHPLTEVSSLLDKKIPRNHSWRRTPLRDPRRKSWPPRGQNPTSPSISAPTPSTSPVNPTASLASNRSSSTSTPSASPASISTTANSTACSGSSSPTSHHPQISRRLRQAALRGRQAHGPAPQPQPAQVRRSHRASDMIFGLGPSGTGKTYLAVAMAVSAHGKKSAGSSWPVQPSRPVNDWAICPEPFRRKSTPTSARSTTHFTTC